MDDPQSECLIDVAGPFVEHLAAAALRFESQNPTLLARIEGAACRLVGPGAATPEMRSRFLQALYREKIYADGLPMRRALIETLGS